MSGFCAEVVPLSLRSFVRFRSLVLVLTAVLATAGCGGGASSGGFTTLLSSPDTPPSATPAAGVAATPAANTATPAATASAAATPGATVSAAASPSPGGSPGATASPAPSTSATPGFASPPPTAIVGGGPLCLPLSPVATLASPRPIRFGIDVGLAGNLTPATVGATPVPVDRAREAAPLNGLPPPRGKLVVRLNRLFWSGGEPLLQQFATEASYYAQNDYDVEVQVRYMPPAGDVDDIADWVTYVRHVVDVLGANDHLVALTITNEVNFDVSPNTSDGAYPGAMDALIQGIEAGADEAARKGWGQRIQMGFTFAYRLDPATDSALFDYIGTNGGDAFRSALGFVGLDDYPGTVYPPAFPPGDSAAAEMGDAIATMRDCYLPLAGIPATTPLWITENGYGSANSATATQADALTGMIDEVRALSGTYDVTDYRWFDFRDNSSTGTGTFDQDGLLLDSYAAKPSYARYQTEIAIGS